MTGFRQTTRAPLWLVPVTSAQGISVAPKPLRIAFQLVTHFGEPLHPTTAGTVREAAALMASLSHHVEEARPSFDAQALKDDMFTICAGRTRQGPGSPANTG